MASLDVQGQLNKALAAHNSWKARLRTAIETKSSDVSPATVKLDNQCDFGKFLTGALAPELRTNAHYANVKDLHAQFHLEAANVLTMALAGDTTGATKSMGLGSNFSRISSALTLTMMDWQKSL